MKGISIVDKEVIISQLADENSPLFKGQLHFQEFKLSRKKIPDVTYR